MGSFAPLLPPDVDLTNFEFMPLDVRRLRDSKTGATVTGDEFRAAVMLWCAAWHQVPAASVPDDDIELSLLAGYGRVVKEWRKVREGALRGWIKCWDGRLWHPVIAEKAAESWHSKRIRTWEKECERIRKENKKRQAAGRVDLPIPERPPRIASKILPEDFDFPPEKWSPTAVIPPEPYRPPAGNPPENALNRKGEGEGKEDSSELRSAVRPKTPEGDRFDVVLGHLGALLRRTPDGCRGYLGSLRKHAKNNDLALFEAIEMAAADPPANPSAWLMAAAKAVGARRNGPGALLFDVADPRGIRSWIAKQPGVHEGTSTRSGRKVPCLNGYPIEDTAEDIADAAGLDESWRGSWDALGAWLIDDVGIMATQLQAIRDQAARMRRDGQTIGSVKVFDRAVREQRRVA